MNDPQSSWQRMLPLVAVGAMAASYSIFHFLDRDMVYALGREDGVFENLSAYCFFCASFLFACAFWRSGARDPARPGRRNVWFLLLSILFFFGGGEEISWGQRIFGWETPQAFEQANLQRETNIHNLKIFNRNDANWQGKTGVAAFVSAERLFSLFWLGFCIGVPLLHATTPPMRRLLDRLRMPIVPLALGALFLVNYATAEILKPHALRLSLQWPLMEIKECLFSMLFLLIAIHFVTRQPRGQQVAAAAAAAPAAPLATASPRDVAPVAIPAGAVTEDDDDKLAHAHPA